MFMPIHQRVWQSTRLTGISSPLEAAMAPSPEVASNRAKRLPAATRVQAGVLDDVAENGNATAMGIRTTETVHDGGSMQ